MKDSIISKHEREMKYIKHTIINMCDEAMGMVVCGKNEKAFEVLKAANTILEFEKWNRAGDFSGLKEVKPLEKACKKVFRAETEPLNNTVLISRSCSQVSEVQNCEKG